MTRTDVGPNTVYRQLEMIAIIFVLCLSQLASANRDLNPCCGEGRRAYARTGSCTALTPSQNQQLRGHSCQRTSGICCLRSLFESKCAEGETKGKAGNSCSSTKLDVLGGGFEKVPF